MGKTLIVIAGPTAVGKTAIAIRLASEFGADILSADSRQFYRGISIGTAKPTSGELRAARHHFIDTHDISENFSVGQFEQQALTLLDQLFKTNDLAILAGGSGLYLDAVCRGFDQVPPPATGIREELNQEYLQHGLEKLTTELQRVDPDYFGQVDLRNPQRVIRALEVWRSTGRPFSSFRKSTAAKRPFNIIWIGLNIPREQLYIRINGRVDSMISGGLVDEARQFYPYKDLNALKTVGYAELFDWLDGSLTFDEAVALIKQNTRRFAKRQLTWFRKNPEINWFEPEDYDEIVNFLRKEIS